MPKITLNPGSFIINAEALRGLGGYSIYTGADGFADISIEPPLSDDTFVSDPAIVWPDIYGNTWLSERQHIRDSAPVSLFSLKETLIAGLKRLITRLGRLTGKDPKAEGQPPSGTGAPNDNPPNDNKDAQRPAQVRDLGTERFLRELDQFGLDRPFNEYVGYLSENTLRHIGSLRPGSLSEEVTQYVRQKFEEMEYHAVQYLHEIVSNRYPLEFLFLLKRLGILPASVALALAHDFSGLQARTAEVYTVNAAAYSLAQSHARVFSTERELWDTVQGYYREALSKEPQAIVELISTLSLFPRGHLLIAKMLLSF